MKTILSTTALALLVVAGTQVTNAAGPKQSTSAYECVTDDGYGRMRPCSAGYMQKRADSNVYDCFTDDGYGRKLPCSFRIKR